MNAIIGYIVKYTTKSETTSKTYMDVIEKMCTDKSENNSARSTLMKLIISSRNGRDYSAQEAAHIFMSWPLHSSTREFKTLNLFEERIITIEVI